MRETIVRPGKKASIGKPFPYQHPLFSESLEEQEPVISVVEMDYVYAYLRNQKAFLENGRPVNSVSTALGLNFLKRNSANVDFLDKRILDLVTPGSNLYSHWLLDLIPKLKSVEDAGYNFNKDFDCVVVNYYGQSFKREMLELIGLNEDKVHDFRNFPKFFKAKKVVSVSPCRKALYTPDWVEEYVNSLFPSDKDFVFSDKVYISRSKGNSRRVVNEAELIENIYPKGYKTLYCEDHSVAFTANVLRNATHVIAPHGAGLANLVFSNSKQKVIELFSAHISAEFYKLSYKKDLEYYPLQIPSSSGGMIELSRMDYNKDREFYHSMNMFVDDKSMHELLKLC